MFGLDDHIANLSDGATLGTDATTPIVDLDQLFNTLRPPTRHAIQNVIKGQEAVYAAPPETFRISETTVHMADEATAIVSFAYEQQAKNGPSGRFAFVDVWRKKGNDWRLWVRYAAPSSETKVPGWAHPAGQIRKAY